MCMLHISKFKPEPEITQKINQSIISGLVLLNLAKILREFSYMYIYVSFKGSEQQHYYLLHTEYRFALV